MTEQTNPDLMQQLAAQLAAIQQQKPAAATGWSTPTTTAPAIQGVAVPIKVSTARGEIRLYLQLPAECTASPETIISTLQALDAQGMPLDFWQPKSSGWGDSSSGGGWNRGSGGSGWNRGGWRR